MDKLVSKLMIILKNFFCYKKIIKEVISTRIKYRKLKNIVDSLPNDDKNIICNLYGLVLKKQYKRNYLKH